MGPDQIADRLERLHRRPYTHGGGREILLDAARELRKMAMVEEEFANHYEHYAVLVVENRKLMDQWLAK